ncbi:MAG: hypothetical protein HN919_12720 [Verrucomicrobia bacterium]|nr:hypothetical protein [Verrucomicrobiota bacterium]MBT7067162.1 hypothetical protein [Verrucomicrobiota bacterium]MBT7701698.1 hypothetical protein [Verrucomicrobiota bacterium]
MKKTLMAIGLLATLSVALLAYAGGRVDDPLGIAVSPQMLLLGAEQNNVKVHTSIPLSLVNRATLELNGIASISSYADALGQLVAVFSEDEVKDSVSPPSETMTLTGLYVSGAPFEGSDTVTVTVYRGR